MRWTDRQKTSVGLRILFSHTLANTHSPGAHPGVWFYRHGQCPVIGTHLLARCQQMPLHIQSTGTGKSSFYAQLALPVLTPSVSQTLLYGMREIVMEKLFPSSIHCRFFFLNVSPLCIYFLCLFVMIYFLSCESNFILFLFCNLLVYWLYIYRNLVIYFEWG